MEPYKSMSISIQVKLKHYFTVIKSQCCLYVVEILAKEDPLINKKSFKEVNWYAIHFYLRSNQELYNKAGKISSHEEKKISLLWIGKRMNPDWLTKYSCKKYGNPTYVASGDTHKVHNRTTAEGSRFWDVKFCNVEKNIIIHVFLLERNFTTLLTSFLLYSDHHN